MMLIASNLVKGLPELDFLWGFLASVYIQWFILIAELTERNLVSSFCYSHKSFIFYCEPEGTSSCPLPFFFSLAILNWC